MRPTTDPEQSPFYIKDCALVVLATGRKALLLQELRNELKTIAAASIYHHFWGGLLQPRFEHREFNNDFAAWVRHGVHDAVLAERLAAVDPTRFQDLELLREEILELIDARIEEAEALRWTRATEQFEFLCARIVVFDTRRTLSHPDELAEVVPQLSTSSLFYHFIDARRRTADGRDDFSDWLSGFDGRHEQLQWLLAGVDPYFGTLSDLRENLARIFRACSNGGDRS
jgi:hypothetical protein